LSSRSNHPGNVHEKEYQDGKKNTLFAMNNPFVQHETTEMRRLIAEIDSRLVDCRSLVSPCSRAASQASSETSSSKANVAGTSSNNN
jgi:hypothetical protein